MSDLVRLRPVLIVLLVGVVGIVHARPSAEAHVDGDGHSHEQELSEPLIPFMTADGMTFPHIHGLGYTSDGQKLIVPAHDGLRVHEEGEWREAGTPHDFMGFAPVDGGFFSSGHPTPLSRLPNPLGLVKVDEDGWNVQLMGFQGESDFHHIAAGYYSRTLYLVNDEANRTIGTGLFAGDDGGRRWEARAAAGVAGEIHQIAVHPTDPLVVALATSEGLFLSSDGGRRFSIIAEGHGIYAATFSPGGRSLYYGGDSLLVWDLTQKTSKQIPFDEDSAAVTFIAVNPVFPRELTIATKTISIYTSKDGGAIWESLVEDGLGR